MSALHQAIQLITRQESRASIDAGAHQLNSLADAGCDPNILEHGQSALCLLMQDQEQVKSGGYPQKPDELRHAKITVNLSIFKLVEMGADPWAGDPNVWEMPGTTHQNLRDLMRALAYREHTGKKARGPRGETPLHAVIARFDIKDIRLSDYCNTMYAGTDGTRRKVIEWQGMRDHDGNLPLHLLWKKAKDERDEKPGQFIRYALQTQASILGVETFNGIDWRDAQNNVCAHGIQIAREALLQTNDHGETLADLMLAKQHIWNAEQPHNLPRINAWHALARQVHEETELRRATPEVGSAPRARRF